MRVVFMGTPEYGRASLKALVDAGYDVVGVFTQPDKPKGRGKKLAFSPVKEYALEKGIDVFQPLRIKKDGVEALKALKPDLCVTAAFGQILSQEILDIPRLGTVNVHASLLPKYRGSSPVQWCIMKGEKVTGVTTMLTDAGIDTGKMLLKRECEILENERSDSLLERLSVIGAELLIETLEKLEKGELCPLEQDENEMSYYPMIKKELGEILWTETSGEIIGKIHGLYPWPCASTNSANGRLKLLKAHVERKIRGEAGRVLCADCKKGLLVGTADGAVWIDEVQAEGGKQMSAKDYLRGHSFKEGSNIQGEGL